MHKGSDWKIVFEEKINPVFLIVIFYTIHNYLEYFEILTSKDVLLFFVVTFLISLLIYKTSFLFFKDNTKRLFQSTLIVFLSLFFGVLQDKLSTSKFLAILSFMPVTLILCLLFFIIAIVFLKKKKIPKSFIRFLNFLFFLLIIVDCFQLILIFNKKSLNAAEPITQRKNNISFYLIILDEYSGNETLKQNFSFDNSNFIEEMKKRNFFYIENSVSNYSWTIYSMASLLNMKYLENPGKFSADNHYGYKKALSMLKNSCVIDSFRRHGYKIINNSPFEIPGANSSQTNSFILTGLNLLANSTLPFRIYKSTNSFIESKNIWKNSYYERIATKSRLVLSTMSKTIAYAKSHKNQPTFSYIHFTVPHGPYLTSVPSQENDFKKNELDQYLKSLRYCNQIFLPWIDEIKKIYNNNVFIVVMSDHGFRFLNDPEKNKKYSCNNINFIYNPEKKYDNWYNGMSNVNQFRIVFTNLFHSDMELLKDSIIVP